MNISVIRNSKSKMSVACVVLMAFCCLSLVAAEVSSEMFMMSPFFGQGEESGATTTAPATGTPSGVASYAEQLGDVSTSSAQTNTNTGILPEERVLAAISSGEYPVTPGDVYSLSYIDGQTPVLNELQVDGSCAVSVPGIGMVDGAGLTYAQMKTAIENLVLMYHPYSIPQCRLVGTGVFSVVVKGEVSSTQRVSAWGLSPLSSVVGLATPYASTRSVEIQRRDGTSSTYDLYKAMRNGDLSQDPLLASGDIVILKKASRIVTLDGEVYRPGTYQLLPGQQLFALLDVYGGGLLTSADTSKVRVERYDSADGTWDAMFVNSRTDGSYQLQNLDKVVVEKVVPTTQSVSIEGAIAVNRSTTTNTDSVSFLTNATTSKMFYQFYPGETVLDMLRAVSYRFNTTSDLAAMYMVREGQMIPLDAQKILYGDGAGGDVKLLGGDRFVVPFNQMFVTVSGAVVSPGTFAYVPDRPVSYYLALAGGISADATKPNSVKIADAAGNTLDTDSIVPPEAIITVARNTFSNDISKTVAIVGLVSSVVTIIATVVTILVNTNVISK